jgi:hypothetical protein
MPVVLLIVGVGGILLVFIVLCVVIALVLRGNSDSGTTSGTAAPPPVAGGAPAPAGPKRLPGDPYAYFRQCVKEGKVSDVAVKGSNTPRTFRDVPEEGAILIGFHVGLEKFVGNNDVVSALRPIYQTKNGEKVGAWYGKPPDAARTVTIKAQAGYAVNGVGIRTGLRIDGLSLETAKLVLAEGRLDPTDRLSSQWVGGPGGGADVLRGPGAVLVGVHGHLNNQGTPCSLGLVAVVLP